MSQIQKAVNFSDRCTGHEKKEDFTIINIVKCDRCGIEQPRGNSTTDKLEKLVWVHYHNNIDICPGCLTAVEVEAAKRHIKTEITQHDNYIQKLQLKLNAIRNAIETANYNKQYVVCFQESFNQKKAA